MLGILPSLWFSAAISSQKEKTTQSDCQIGNPRESRSCQPPSKPSVFRSLKKAQPLPFSLYLEERRSRSLKGTLSQSPLCVGPHVRGLTGFVPGTRPDLACGSRGARSELGARKVKTGEKPTGDSVREDAALFRRLECLSLIARHDSVSTVMICSQVA